MVNNRTDLELITSLVDKEARILDVGCGNGELLKSLKNKIPADLSSSSFFIVLTALSENSELTIKNVNININKSINYHY